MEAAKRKHRTPAQPSAYKSKSKGSASLETKTDKFNKAGSGMLKPGVKNKDQDMYRQKDPGINPGKDIGAMDARGEQAHDQGILDAKGGGGIDTPDNSVMPDGELLPGSDKGADLTHQGDRLEGLDPAAAAGNLDQLGGPGIGDGLDDFAPDDGRTDEDGLPGHARGSIPNKSGGGVADPRISTDDDTTPADGTTAPADTTAGADTTADGGGTSTTGSDGESGMSEPGSGDAGTPASSNTFKKTIGRIYNSIPGVTGAGGSQAPIKGGGGGGVRGTPDPEIGASGSGGTYDPDKDKNANKFDTLIQPGSPEEYGNTAKPKPTIGSQTDPYTQAPDDADGFGVNTGEDEDAAIDSFDNNLIDPPDMATGGGGTPKDKDEPK
ncbi:MAG: hypothetical protein GY727_00025 [Gammaproteobacteria bacterium]|nr:hypothetical protein [Gammaproteobacteria bacterium]